MTTPVGALGAGAGSGMASGRGCGITGALGTTFFGTGGVGGAGRTGSTLGAGGSTNCVRISAGTMTSAARIKSPLCRAQINATCRPTTARAITALRLKGWRGVGWRGALEKTVAVIENGWKWVDMSPRPCRRLNQELDQDQRRKIHQVQPITKARLTGSAAIRAEERFARCSMGCLPVCGWLA